MPDISLDERDKKPFDRKMLDLLSERVAGLGIVCDMGCGPGQITRYLHDLGPKHAALICHPRWCDRQNN